MSDALRKVRTGDSLRFPAEAYNAFVDAATDYRNRAAGRAGGGRQVFRGGGVALVRNDSVADRDRFDALYIVEPIVTPAQSANWWIDGVAFSIDRAIFGDAGKPFAVLLEAIPAGEFGYARVDGPAILQITVAVADATSADFADLARGLTMPVGRATGSARILWREGGLGPQWAVVQLGDGSAGARLVQASELMDADATEFAAAYVSAAGETGDALTVQRPPGVYVPLDAVGVLADDGAGVAAFIPCEPLSAVGANDTTADLLAIKIASDAGSVLVTVWTDGVPGDSEGIQTLNLEAPMVGTSAADTTLGYLSDELTCTDGKITKTILNPGANETLDLSVNEAALDGGSIAGVSDEKVKVSEDDTAAGYLEGKITSTGATVLITTLTPGGDEDLNLEVDGAAIDISGNSSILNLMIERYKVLVSDTDTLPEFLDVKVVGDDWIVPSVESAGEEGEEVLLLSHGDPQTPDTPDTVGDTDEGDEAAATDGQALDASGLQVHEMTRMAYYDAGDATLYGYVRTWTIDGKGHVQGISNETRISIDVPEACAGDEDELVSADEGTTPGYLSDVLVSTDGTITLAVDGDTLDIAVDESQLSLSGITDAFKVMVSANDSTPNYLLTKVAAGTNIAVAETGDGGDEDVTISHAAPGAPGSPDTVGVNTEGTEAAYTDGQAVDSDGVLLYAMTRVGYYDAGDATLYGYVRALTFDQQGHLVSVGNETRVSIDVAEACT